MTRLADRLLARLAPKADVQAGCTNTYFCKNHVKYIRACCLDQGCQVWAVGKC